MNALLYNEKGLLNRISFLLNLLVSISIISLAAFAWPAADDFSFIHDMKGHNFLSFGIHQYLKWDGRLLSNLTYGCIYQNMNYFDLKHVFFLFMFLVECLVIGKLLSINLKYKIRCPYFYYLIILLSIWLGLKPILNETVYWLAGSVQYTLIPLINVTWLFLFYKCSSPDFKWENRRIGIPLFYLLTFFAGNGNQASSPALFLVGVFIVLKHKRKIFEEPFILFTLLVFLFGMIALFAAPGNFRRAKYGEHSFNLSIQTLIVNYKVVWTRFFSIGKNIILTGFLASLINTLSIEQTNLWQDSTTLSIKNYLRRKKEDIIIVFLLLISLFISVAPFMMVPDFAAPRASVFFQIFLFMLTWKMTGLSAEFVFIKFEKTIKTFSAYIVIGVLICLLLTFSTLYINTIRLEIPVRNQFTERFQMLSNMKNEEKKKDVTVTKIKGELPTLIFFNDVSPDTSNWINTNVANFYGLKSIRIEESAN